MKPSTRAFDVEQNKFRKHAVHPWISFLMFWKNYVCLFYLFLKKATLLVAVNIVLPGGKEMEQIIIFTVSLPPLAQNTNMTVD